MFYHNSKGVAISFKKRLDIKVSASKTYNDGKFLSLFMIYSGKQKILANLHASKDDNQRFFKNFFSQLDSFENTDNIMVFGDFSLVLDSLIDYENYKDTNHNINSRKLSINFVNEKELIDRPF